MNIQYRFKYNRYIHTMNILRKFQPVSNVRCFVDVGRSKGQYVIDSDGRKFLDMITNIASLPLGWNHRNLLARSKELSHNAANRTANLVYPTLDHVYTLDRVLKRCKPSAEHNYIYTDSTGSLANENALKAAFLYKSRTKGAESSSMEVLSLDRGFHGRTLGTLSATRSDPSHRAGFPCFQWTKVNLDGTVGNISLSDYVERNHGNISCFITEPILAEGGDIHLPDDFFRHIRDVTHSHDIPLIVDEVQTGMYSTGKLWAHEHWNCPIPPDIVTFSKKFQIGGFFALDKFMPDFTYQICNTWVGDTLRTMLCETIIDTIEEEGLVERVHRVGGEFKAALAADGKLSNVRGRGTFIAFDIEKRDDFIQQMYRNGVLVMGCGENSIRLRPSLIFDESDAEVFMSALEKVSQ